MKPPPFAQWMMDALTIEFITAIEEGAPIVYNDWTIREDHNDALLSLRGENGRSADVWVDWPSEYHSGDHEVTLCIVVSQENTSDCGRSFTGTPQELAAWLKGAV